MMGDLDDVAPEDQVTVAVDLLRAHDPRWHARPVPGITMVTLAWEDGTVDTLMLLSPDSAYGVRESEDGRQPWSTKGTLQQVIDLARRDLVSPDSPDAPKALGSDLPRTEWR